MHLRRGPWSPTLDFIDRLIGRRYCEGRKSALSFKAKSSAGKARR